MKYSDGLLKQEVVEKNREKNREENRKLREKMRLRFDELLEHRIQETSQPSKNVESFRRSVKRSL